MIKKQEQFDFIDSTFWQIFSSDPQTQWSEGGTGTDCLLYYYLLPPQEEVSVVGEEAVELDGGPSPSPVLYQGPVFPPQTRSALPAQEQATVLGLDPQRDALENRLVEWWVWTGLNWSEPVPGGADNRL